MRLSAVILAIAASVSARTLIPREGQTLVSRDDLDVPGQNPLKFCEANRGTDIITIEEVILTPNPPQAYVDSEIHLIVRQWETDWFVHLLEAPLSSSKLLAR